MTWIALLVVGLMAASWVAGGVLLRLVTAPRPDRCRAGGAARRAVSILVVGALAAGAISLFAPARRVSTPPPAERRMARMSARELQRHAAESAVAGGATAGQKAFAVEQRKLEETEFVNTPTSPPGTEADEASEVRPGVAIRIARVKSGLPHSLPEKALADALLAAQGKLAERLAALDPPVRVVPPLDVIRRDYLRPGSIKDVLPTEQNKEDWRAAGLGENRQWTEVDIEVSDSQLRALRAQERTADGGLVAGTALAAFAALFGFLRLDTWTKGYLTTTLALTAAGIVGGAVALLAWVR